MNRIACSRRPRRRKGSLAANHFSILFILVTVLILKELGHGGDWDPRPVTLACPSGHLAEIRSARHCSAHATRYRNSISRFVSAPRARLLVLGAVRPARVVWAPARSAVVLPRAPTDRRTTLCRASINSPARLARLFSPDVDNEGLRRVARASSRMSIMRARPKPAFGKLQNPPGE